MPLKLWHRSYGENDLFVYRLHSSGSPQRDIVNSMSVGPSDKFLPRTTIQRSKRKLSRFLFQVALIWSAIVLILWAVGGNSTQIVGSIVILAIMLTLLVLQATVIRGAQRRKQQDRMKNLPPNGIFTVLGSLYPPKGISTTPVYGAITFNTEGLTFRAKKGTDSFSLTWPEVASMDLRPTPGKFGIGTLTMSLLDGDERRFSVQGMNQLAEVIDQHS
jgi:hypothetical protein